MQCGAKTREKPQEEYKVGTHRKKGKKFALQNYFSRAKKKVSAYNICSPVVGQDKSWELLFFLVP